METHWASRISLQDQMHMPDEERNHTASAMQAATPKP